MLLLGGGGELNFFCRLVCLVWYVLFLMNNSESSSVASGNSDPGATSPFYPQGDPSFTLNKSLLPNKKGSVSGLRPPQAHRDRFSVILNFSTYSGKDYNAELMTINQVQGTTVNIVSAKNPSATLLPSQQEEELDPHYKMLLQTSDASGYSSTTSNTKLVSISADNQSKMEPVSRYKTAIEGSIPPRSSRRPKSEVIHGTPVLPVKEDSPDPSHRFSLSDDLEKLMETASIISKGETSDSKQFIFKDIKKEFNTFSLPKVRTAKRSSITSDSSSHSPTRVIRQSTRDEANDISPEYNDMSADLSGKLPDTALDAHGDSNEDPHTSGSADDGNGHSSGTIVQDQQTALTSAQPSPQHKRMSSVNSQTSSNLKMPPRPLVESILRAREVSHQYSLKSNPDNSSVKSDQVETEDNVRKSTGGIVQMGGAGAPVIKQESQFYDDNTDAAVGGDSQFLPEETRHSHTTSFDYPSDISRFDEVDSGVYAKSHQGYIVNPSEDVSSASPARYDQHGISPIKGAPPRETPEEITDMDVDEVHAQPHDIQYRDTPQQMYDDTQELGNIYGETHPEQSGFGKTAVDEDFYDIGEPEVVRNQPARAKSVRENTRRTKRKKSTKHKNKKELKPFTYTTLVSLLESMNGTVIGEEFNQLNLPIREKQWIEKIIDSLSRLTSDMVMDENKFEAGLTRLEKAHRALEGFL